MNLYRLSGKQIQAGALLAVLVLGALYFASGGSGYFAYPVFMIAGLLVVLGWPFKSPVFPAGYDPRFTRGGLVVVVVMSILVPVASYLANPAGASAWWLIPRALGFAAGITIGAVLFSLIGRRWYMKR